MASSKSRDRYIWEKPGARNLWFRMAVPVQYREVARCKIVQRDLGTKNRVTASVAVGRLRAELFDEWQRRLTGDDAGERIGKSPITADFHRVVGEYYRRSERRWKLFEQQLTLGEAQRAERLVLLEQAFNEILDGGHIRSIAAEMVDQEQWDDVSGDQFDELCGILREASLDVLRVEILRLKGQIGAKPESEAVLAGIAAQASKAEEYQSLVELFERYAKQRLVEKAKRPDSINQDRKVFSQFSAFVGTDRALPSITAVDVRNWRDTMAQVPPGYTKTKTYNGLDLREVAAAAKSQKRKGLHPLTVNKNLSAVSAFFRWAVSDQYVPKNPCDGLFLNTAKVKKRRLPFTIDQLNAIFASPLFTGFLCAGKEHIEGTQRADDWRYWIPLCCLFTGARIGEIAQLRLDDIAEKFEVPLFHFREDEDFGQRTKSGRSRFAPIHSKLIGLGFLGFVARQRKAATSRASEQLFPELKPNSRDQISGKPSRFFRDYLRRIGVKTGADGFGAHAFRHTLADQLRTAGYIDNEISVALGHSSHGVTAGYGVLQQGSAKRLQEMFEAVTFDGLDLNALVPDANQHNDRP